MKLLIVCRIFVFVLGFFAVITYILCHFVLVQDAEKTTDMNFDEHEELITELHALRNLRQMITEKKITHSIGLNAIFMLLLHFGM